MIRTKLLATTVLGSALVAGISFADIDPTLGFLGSAGLIEMPTADMMPDAEFSMSYSEFADTQNIGVSFQFTEDLFLSYRINKLDNFDGNTRYDGIWDIGYQIFDETEYMPAVAVGFRDFLGTGVTASQYVVATKTIADQLKVSAGVGWGRLGDTNEVQTDYTDEGGSLRFDEYFSGPMGYFGGIEWATPVEGLTFKAEYSSDSYVQENSINLPQSFDRKSDFNFGLEYQTKLNFTVGAYYLYGSEVGFRVSSSLNPRRGRPQGYVAPAPLPIQPRDPAEISDLSWLDGSDVNTQARNALAKTLGKDGIGVRKINLTGNRVHLVVSSGRLQPAAQTFGRVARALTYVMPESVETFVIAIQMRDFETVQMTINRSDLERYELSPNGIRESAGAFEISDAPYPLDGMSEWGGKFPRFNWGISPYFSVTLFSSGDQPALRAGLAANATYTVSERLSFGAGARLPLIDGSTDSTGDGGVGPDDSVYFTNAEVTLTRLSADYYTKISDNVYGKFNAGIFSSKWVGVAGEVLYKPADQRWGVGFDVAHVTQRDSETVFGLLDYNVVTGHASLYYSAPNGFDYEINAGRYLAGDWGATVAVDRTFDNGWRVGVFATLTDMDAEEFGSGRFQKGFSVDIPLGWAIGTQTRRTIGDRIASTSGEGGARLSTPGNLYNSVNRFHIDNVSGTWGAFWK